MYHATCQHVVPGLCLGRVWSPPVVPGPIRVCSGLCSGRCWGLSVCAVVRFCSVGPGRSAFCVCRPARRRLLSWRRPYNLWVAHTTWHCSCELILICRSPLQVVTKQLRGLPGGWCTVHWFNICRLHSRSPLYVVRSQPILSTTHKRPIPIHFYMFRRSLGDYLGAMAPVQRSEDVKSEGMGLPRDVSSGEWCNMCRPHSSPILIPGTRTCSLYGGSSVSEIHITCL